MSMITATTWVPRGHAAPFPTKYDFDEKEFARIQELAKLQLEDAKEDLEEAENDEEEKTAGAATNGTSKGGSEKIETDEKQDKDDDDDDLKVYDLDNYDNDDFQEGEGDVMGMFGNIKTLVYHESNEQDPYITMKQDPDEDSDREEQQILATDNLVLAARIDDEVAYLEVYVYEDDEANLYVHHDIMLPAVPLTVEWLDLPVGKTGATGEAKGNYVAVGTMDPDIELWDLDTIDCMYPNAILGEGGQTAEDKKQKKKKKKKSRKANDAHHVDAVLSLAANHFHRNLLASASADKTVKLWDLNTCTCAKSYTHHTDKVCSLAWNPSSEQSTVLLSGSYDRTACVLDMRAPTDTPPRWGVESDIETVAWDPHNTHHFYVSTENGMLHAFDSRKVPSDPAASKPLWTLQAHSESISSFSVNPAISGFIATGSTDKSVKLWNISESGPSMIVSRDLGVGKVFSTTFAPDPEVGFRLAVAGSKGSVQIWDTSTNPGVRTAFATRVKPADGEVEERLVGVDESDSDSEDDEEQGEGEDGPDGGVAIGTAEDSGEDKDGWESMSE